MNKKITPCINSYEEYSLHNKSLLCAYLSHISYLDEEDMNEWTNEMNIKDHTEYSVDFTSSKSLQFNIITSDTHQFITFRGTDTYYGMMETIQDLIVSLNFLPIKSKDGILIHRGYYKAAKTILKIINEMNVIDNNKKLVLCGHSMGAAIAKCISHLIDCDVDLFTFGSPQVSRNKSVPNRNIRFYGHYINKNDIIPYFPSKIYNDCSVNYILSEKDDITCEFIKSSGILMPFLKLALYSLKKHISLFDRHSISLYVIRLHKEVKKGSTK